MTHFDLNLARVFVAIYETGSATAAAERLDITQPSVSYSLAKLREALADPLFVRFQRSLKPTPRADTLYPRFRDVLASVDEAIDDTHRFDPALASRIFNLAMSDIGGMYFLPRLERELCTEAPRITLDVRQVPISELADQLASLKIDVALGNLESLRRQTRSLTLFREHYVCLLSKQHAERIGMMTLDAFRRSRHVAVSSPSSGHRLAEDALADMGISRQIVIRTPYFTALPQLMAQSDLIVLLPSRAARIFVTQGDMVVQPAPMELPEFEVKMYWHQRHETNPSVAWLLERLEVLLREP
ncbi:LysR family transcriptional regulator [Azoarcus sp. KH32C]|uniref:LysR family transcriptional regulator n=1 Tax=Azoarcus sp. KH32C TaxID=748247 RepID=UPI0002386703|nr:LysR family transcriptional regulator [Azoarcus sp. KH32C]BAL24201.1 transcriptional regulator, LysR family [Azoarcus sp. KH32C]